MARFLHVTEPFPTVVFFDGQCHLCSRTVRWVLRHERGPVLRFCALQSNTAGRLLGHHAATLDGIDSLVVLEGGRVLVRSDAALAIAATLRAPWRWMRAMGLLPRFLRDRAYDFIARHRYRWFGRSDDACLMPAPGMRERLLDDDR